jgi:hypothetical protein
VILSIFTIKGWDLRHALGLGIGYWDLEEKLKTGDLYFIQALGILGTLCAHILCIWVGT